MKLLEMQLNSALRAKYLEVKMPGFFSYIHEKWKKKTNFRMFPKKIIAMFGFTYVCELLFSLRKLAKKFSEKKAVKLSPKATGKLQKMIE